MTLWTRLIERSVLEVGGADAETLLQGLVSNDLDRLAAEPALYAALLTPQGKYLFDFIMFRDGDRFLLDIEAERAADLVRRLTLYRLRAAVTFSVLAEPAVYALFDPDLGAFEAAAMEGAIVAAVDPRYRMLGWRIIGEPGRVEPLLDKLAGRVDSEVYDHFRASLGIPEGSRDLAPDKALLLESGFAELDGVAFDKGCFVGQELTARMKYRATVRKRLVPVRLEAAIEAGTLLLDGDIEVGELRSVYGDVGLALIRLDRWQKAKDANRSLQAGAVTVEPWVPDWVDLSLASKTATQSP